MNITAGDLLVELMDAWDSGPSEGNRPLDEVIDRIREYLTNLRDERLEAEERVWTKA